MFNSSKADEYRQLAKDTLSHSRDWARVGQDLARKGSHRAQRFIHKKPMAATLIALVIGYLLGKVLSKGKKAATVSAPEKGAGRGRSRRS